MNINELLKYGTVQHAQFFQPVCCAWEPEAVEVQKSGRASDRLYLMQKPWNLGASEHQRVCQRASTMPPERFQRNSVPLWKMAGDELAITLRRHSTVGFVKAGFGGGGHGLVAANTVLGGLPPYATVGGGRSKTLGINPVSEFMRDLNI